MIRFLVERPVSVVMVFIAVIILGVVSINKIPISLLPDVDIPEITIQVSAPEKSARQVEEDYISGIRRGMLQVAHLEDVETFAFNESGYMRLIFDYGTDIQYSYIEVNEKIDALMQRMPEGFERPRVIKASATDIPVFYLTVSLKEGLEDGLGNRFMELSEFSEQVIKRRIEQLAEVAMVDISGMEYPEIRIEVDLKKLDILGLSPGEIESALTQNDISASNIKVRNGMYEFNVKYSSLLANRFDIENLVMKSKNRIFKLSEVATITVRARSGKGFIINKQGKAISMAVIKKANARMEDLKKSTEELLTAIKADYPRIQFETTRNQTKLLDYTLSSLKSSLVVGATLAFLVLFFFLKDLKSPLLIGISIPVSLVVSLLFFYLFGISINVISLAGLIVGIGLMIDNSIIVIDNIVQHAEKYPTGDVGDVSARGTVEVISPLISSALTTCAVFVPLIFLGGIAGALFYDQALSITIGLASSFFVSITLIPVLYTVLTRNNRFSAKVRFLGKYGYLTDAYEAGYFWVMRNKRSFMLLTALVLVLGTVAFFTLEKERFPSFEQTEVVAEIDWNQNINEEENRNRVQSFVKEADSLILHMSAMIGEQWFLLDRSGTLSGTQASAWFQCASADSLEVLIAVFERWMKEHYPVATYKLLPPENLFEKIFGSGQAPLEVRLTSTDADGIPSPEELMKVTSHIHQQSGTANSRKHALQEVYELRPEFDRLLLYDVDPNRLIRTLQTALNRLPVFTLRQGQFEVPVVLTEKSNDLHAVLSRTQVRSGKGVLVPVHELVKVHRVMGYKSYEGGKNGAYASLVYHIPDHEADGLMVSINAVLSAAYPQIKVAFSGSILSTRTILSQMWMILLVAILLLYFILASQFESLLQPLIVFLEIPIDVASALLFLWMFGESLNLLAVIGIIVMSGIIINDSILKIDTINRLRKEGLTIDEAIKVGGKRRLKPIIMTSATTILAMIPFLWGDDMGSVLQRPLAVTVIGGMLIGTFVSLYFIPLAYRFIYHRSE